MKIRINLEEESLGCRRPFPWEKCLQGQHIAMAGGGRLRPQPSTELGSHSHMILVLKACEAKDTCGSERCSLDSDRNSAQAGDR